jgi:hypothetical protein
MDVIEMDHLFRSAESVCVTLHLLEHTGMVEKACSLSRSLCENLGVDIGSLGNLRVIMVLARISEEKNRR